MRLRYAFTVTNFKLLKKRFGLERMINELKPRYNIAPTQMIPVIFNDDQKTLSEAGWGLDAKWHGASGANHLLFNARSETVDQKPVFKKNFQERRCLILADAFYEWKKPEKRPFRISLADDEVFAFAGIYSEIEGIRKACMLTTAPNGLVSSIHDRMPAILPENKEKAWLDMTAEEAKTLLKPYPADKMKTAEISQKINSSKEDSENLVTSVSKDNLLTKFM